MLISAATPSRTAPNSSTAFKEFEFIRSGQPSVFVDIAPQPLISSLSKHPITTIEGCKGYLNELTKDFVVIAHVANYVSQSKITAHTSIHSAEFKRLGIFSQSASDTATVLVENAARVPGSPPLCRPMEQLIANLKTLERLAKNATDHGFLTTGSSEQIKAAQVAVSTQASLILDSAVAGRVTRQLFKSPTPHFQSVRVSFSSWDDPLTDNGSLAFPPRPKI